MDQYSIPKHLDDPELIGFWTLDEFLVMVIPFAWGIIAQHIVFGLATCAAVDPSLRLDKAFIMRSNAIREHDVRGRLLTLNHPTYGSYLPIVDGMGPGRCLKLLEA